MKERLSVLRPNIKRKNEEIFLKNDEIIV